MLNFTLPAALLWSLLAIPIIVFYILKIRMRRVPVSTVMFWEQVFEEKQPRSIWQKLRHLLSLLMQLALLALLVLALTDPYFPWELQQQKRLILVLDNSASMQATDVEPSRLANAQEVAGAVIDRLRPRDEMAIVTAGTQPEVVCGLTRHHRTLHNVVKAVQPTDGPTQVADAITLGRRLLAEHPNGQIVVVSDGGDPQALSSPSQSLADAPETSDDQPQPKAASPAPVVWLPIGQAVDNVAVTRFQVRRSLLDPLGYQVLVEVQNFSKSPVECRLELDLEENLIDVWPVKLAAGEKWTKHLEQATAEGGVLTAKLNHADALPLDNIAQAILPARKRQPVVLVTPGNRFLQGVFAANPLVDLTVVPQLPEQIPPGAVIVFHKQVPDQLPPGNLVILQPEKSGGFGEIAGALENPLVAKQDQSSPLMTNVRLDNILLPEAMKLVPQGQATILAESASGDPLYFSLQRSNGRVLVLTVNLDRGDLTLRTAFPILFSNALTWFEGSGGELRESLAAGSLSTLKLPRELLATPEGQPTQSLQLTSPTGVQSQVTVQDETVTLGPLEDCGVWTLTFANSTPEAKPASPTAPNSPSTDIPSTTPAVPSLNVACNLANAKESNLMNRPEPPVDVQPTVTAGLAHPLWFYLVATAWLLMGLEWAMYQRRKIS